MNISTGIKSRPAALAILEKFEAENTEEKILKLPAVQQAHARADAVLEKLAVALAIDRVKAQPPEIDVVNCTIRTSTGPQELISIHLVKH